MAWYDADYTSRFPNGYGSATTSDYPSGTLLAMTPGSDGKWHAATEVGFGTLYRCHTGYCDCAAGYRRVGGWYEMVACTACTSSPSSSCISSWVVVNGTNMQKYETMGRTCNSNTDTAYCSAQYRCNSRYYGGPINAANSALLTCSACPNVEGTTMGDSTPGSNEYIANCYAGDSYTDTTGAYIYSPTCYYSSS
jgi:hypothetical protein